MRTGVCTLRRPIAMFVVCVELTHCYSIFLERCMLGYAELCTDCSYGAVRHSYDIGPMQNHNSPLSVQCTVAEQRSNFKSKLYKNSGCKRWMSVMYSMYSYYSQTNDIVRIVLTVSAHCHSLCFFMH